MSNYFALESKLEALTPKKRKQAEYLLGLVEKVMEGEEPRYIQKPEDVYQLLGSEMLPLEKEHFVVLMLNAKNRIIAKKTVSIGTLNASFVHPRETFRDAIVKGAASIVCVHNHPSGDPSPSEQDVEVSERLIAAGEIIGIELLDHVIVATEGFISLKEQGMI